ncbi:MAG: rod shape-determining protein MreC [candidate division NC10 bacterium]|nr:rod shape-determining protein MreC [candidate division NC10 bacterium]
MLLRVFLRYRRAVILSIALLVSFLFMTLQVRQEGPLVDLVERGLVLTVTPFLKLYAAVTGTTSRLWANYVDLRRVRAENLRLQEEMAALREEVRRLAEAGLENSRLRRLLDLPAGREFDLVAAQVIAKDTTNWFKTIMINKGSEAGVQRSLPVIATEGLVGRVLEVMPWTAKVQLLTDPVSSVGALLQEQRGTGLVTGDRGQTATVKYLPLMAEVRVGDVVLTSGMGGVFPKGILIGTVTATHRKSGALFQEAAIQPSVDFGRLEEVLVITRERRAGPPGAPGAPRGGDR